MNANASTLSVPRSAGRSLTQAARFAFIALAVVVLLVVSFALGRATVSASHQPAILPTSGVHTSIESCHVGRPC